MCGTSGMHYEDRGPGNKYESLRGDGSSFKGTLSGEGGGEDDEGIKWGGGVEIEEIGASFSR